MVRILDGTSGSGQPEPDEAEVGVQIIVTQDFAGVSMAELTNRNGQLTGMDVLSHGVLIRGSIPASEFDSLAKAIEAATEHRGKVKRASE